MADQDERLRGAERDIAVLNARVDEQTQRMRIFEPVPGALERFDEKLRGQQHAITDIRDNAKATDRELDATRRELRQAINDVAEKQAAHDDEAETRSRDDRKYRVTTIIALAGVIAAFGTLVAAILTIGAHP